MAVVFKLVRGGDPRIPVEFDGQYLKEFDHEAFDGQGDAYFTKDIKEAKKFPTFMDAMQFRIRVPECKPVREDGQPNRPMTATNWVFETVKD